MSFLEQIDNELAALEESSLSRLQRKVSDYESFGFTSELVTTSCYHHQAIDKLGSGLEVLGRGPDGTIEAVGIESTGWARGVQWHPEDTAREDPSQQGLFNTLVSHAS